MGKKDLVPPGLAYLADNITAKQNVLGAPKTEGARWAKDLGLPKKAATVFFAGCGYQYSNQLECLMSLVRRLDKSPLGVELPMGLANFQKKLGIDLAAAYRTVFTRGKASDGQPLRDMVSVLKKLDIEFGYLAEDEPCCGAPLHFIGLETRFAQNARQVQKQFEAFGVEKIISAVPSCTYALRTLIPRHTGSKVRVEHFVETVASRLPGLDLKFPQKVKVTYHDPCQLARYLELIEPPRRILKAIKNLELVEPATAGQWATCCGGGGGFEAVFPEFSQILAQNRARELVETGAEIITTHCPGCVMQLEEGLKQLKITNIKVMELAQVLAMSLEA
ncbi:MAG: (Fe-S)-binding protein [Chloroflexota bacterium]